LLGAAVAIATALFLAIRYTDRLKAQTVRER
jgi:hypothetical protein